MTVKQEAIPAPSLLPAYAVAAVAVLIWGATPAATKVAVTGLDPMVAGILRTVLAAVVVVPAAMALRLPLPGSRTEWTLLAYSALGGFVGFTLLFSIGVNLTSAAHAALINASIPIFTGLFGAIAEKRVPGRLWMGGVAISFAGVSVLIGFRAEADTGAGATVLGDLFCMGATLCAAFGYVSGSRLAGRIGTFSVTFWGVGLAGLVQLPILVMLSHGLDWQAVPHAAWSGVLYLAVGSTVIAYIAWYWALARGGAVRLGPTQFAMPVISLTLAAWMFSETLTPVILGAALAIVGGIAITRRG
ncbi:MAG: DMT family transporter [Rhodospirillaceae bacterium]|jgi:drug/metabolite transporter (DMT)-like permease|nr:DMT family transporter [Rhodospirillaceae bacterium]